MTATRKARVPMSVELFAKFSNQGMLNGTYAAA